MITGQLHCGDDVFLNLTRESDETPFITAGTLKTLYTKGSDASNIYDEEPREDECVDFSDDEEEMKAKRDRKKGRKGAGTPPSPDLQRLRNEQSVCLTVCLTVWIY